MNTFKALLCTLLLVALGCEALTRTTEGSTDNPPNVFTPEDHIVCVDYFIWYKGFEARHAQYGPSTRAWVWRPTYDDTRIFGDDDDFPSPPQRDTWPEGTDVNWYVANFRAMAYARIDICFVDTWAQVLFQTSANGDPTPLGRKTLTALVRAWEFLENRGEAPPRLAFFLDIFGNSTTDISTDRGNPDGWRILYKHIEPIFRQFYHPDGIGASIGDRALALMKDEKGIRPMIAIFMPRTGTLWWTTGWSQGSFTETKAALKNDPAYGFDPYMIVCQHLHDGDIGGGWNDPQKDGRSVVISGPGGVVEDDVRWFSQVGGPLVSRRQKNTISISTGHWTITDEPSVPANGHYPKSYHYNGPDDTTSRYEDDWREVLDGKHFNQRLLFIETYNELYEGNNLVPCIPRTVHIDGKPVDRWGDSPEVYLELTRKYAPYWKQAKVLPADE